jgi:replicative DNA helicase
MNQDDNPFKLKVYLTHEAFGSNLNDDDDDSDMPFRNYQKPIFL